MIAHALKPPSCNARWSADNDALTSGFDVPERDSVGAIRWMVAREATIVLPYRCAANGTIKIIVGYAITEANLDSLRLQIANENIPLEREFSPAGFIYTGHLPSSQTGFVTAKLSVKRLDSLPNASRRFAVAVRSIEIAPEEEKGR